MKLHVLLAAVCLGVFVSLSGSAAGHTSTQLPVLMRLGEEYFGMLDNGDRRSPSRTEALQLQLTQRLLGGKLGSVGKGIMNSLEERERRSDDPPISLDLTFHLLREVLQMARAEQLAQRASNNRKIMDDLGKKKRKRGVVHPQMSGWDRQLPKYMEKKEKVRRKETDGDGCTDKWKQFLCRPYTPCLSRTTSCLQDGQRNRPPELNEDPPRVGK